MFDPYYEWLGIPVQQQPPNHYRLLGLDDFESNAGVIKNAAVRQLAYIKSFRQGEHDAAAVPVLKGIHEAKKTLCYPEA